MRSKPEAEASALRFLGPLWGRDFSRDTRGGVELSCSRWPHKDQNSPATKLDCSLMQV